MKPGYEPETFKEKLGYLIEECGEVLAAAGKTIRCGLHRRCEIGSKGMADVHTKQLATAIFTDILGKEKI